MATGLPDFVDCARLAGESVVLERIYELGDLGRLSDLLANRRGRLQARFAFVRLDTGRAGAEVTVRATPQLVCQRCMQDFELPVRGVGEIEFARGDDAEGVDSERELYRTDNGLVSLRELAEEELLLALPLAPACDTPSTCGRAPDYASGGGSPDAAGESRRPFSVLQDLLKKT